MLEIENVSIDNRLYNISLTIPPGQLFGLIGPNGAGKSTLLRLIAGLIKPKTGVISCNGKNIESLDRQSLSRMIHLVPQGASTAFDYTARDIVSMGCFHKKSNIEEAMKSVDVAHLASHPIAMLSMGERQRVYLARALVTECPILLFDEPTANLDIRHQMEIWELLQNLTKQNKIIIIATHDLQLTKRCCPLVALINQGQCTKWGTTETTLTDFDIQELFRCRN